MAEWEHDQGTLCCSQADWSSGTAHALQQQSLHNDFCVSLQTTVSWSHCAQALLHCQNHIRTNVLQQGACPTVLL